MGLYELSVSLLGTLPQEATYLYSIFALLLGILAVFIILIPFIILIKVGGK